MARALNEKECVSKVSGLALACQADYNPLESSKEKFEQAYRAFLGENMGTTWKR